MSTLLTPKSVDRWMMMYYSVWLGYFITRSVWWAVPIILVGVWWYDFKCKRSE